MTDLVSVTFLLAFIVIVLASFVQSLTGFGFAIIGVPVLLLFLSPEVSVQLCLFLGLVLSVLAIVVDLRKGLKPVINIPLLLGSLIGIPIGSMIIRSISPSSLKILVSIVVFVFAFLLLRDFSIRISRPKLVYAFVGILSGILISSTGLGGLVVALFFSSIQMESVEMRSNLLIYIIMVSIFTLVNQAFTGTLQPSTLVLGLQLTPALLIGLFIGNKKFKQLGQKDYRNIVTGIILFSCVSSVIAVIQSYM